jgi:predicted dehydrogenase
MNPNDTTNPSRRQFLKTAGGVAAVSALSGVTVPAVHAAGSEEIKVALVGCGGRGSGAAVNALSTKTGPIKLVAMADAFPDRLKSSYTNLQGEVGKKMDVPESSRFIGWDAYQHAMDSLRPGDVVILTTPLAFRAPHFQYAIQKGLNVFMEKPLTADGPTSKRMLKLAEEASAKNLKVGVGLMSRHAPWLQELQKRVMNGEIGDVLLMRGYRMHGPVADSSTDPKPEGISDLDYQVRHFHGFLWASGGCFNDFYIHHVDHLSWMKNAWPVSAQGVGGRHYRTNREGKQYIDQNFDTYTIEYTFADGTKFYFEGRCMTGAEGIYSSYLHGSKGCAIAARANDCSGPSAIFKGQNFTGTPTWQSTEGGNPYQVEWDELIKYIREDKPYNEVKRGVEASVASSMGRAAAHTGQIVTFQDMLNSDHEFAPDIDKLTKDSPAPLQPDASGHFPVPMPGMKGKREF